MNRKYGYGILLSLVLVSAVYAGLVLVGQPQPTKDPPHVLVLASWAYQPDSYGQGFEAIVIEENSSGSWVEVATLDYSSSVTSFDVAAQCALRLTVYTWLNSTLVGAGSGAVGRNYQRHSATIQNSTPVTVYSKTNFTYQSVDTGIDPPLWLYEYQQVLNYLLGYDMIYTVNVTYETYY